MNILILSPGYPAEMPQFTRGLAEVGARVYGVGDQGPGALPALVQKHLSGYLPVRSLWDEEAVVEAVRGWPEARRLDGGGGRGWGGRCGGGRGPGGWAGWSVCGSRGCCWRRASARRWGCPGCRSPRRCRS